MSVMVSQINSLTIACSTVYSGADQRKHQSSASLAFVRGIHRRPVNYPHKGPVTRKMFTLMTSSWFQYKALVHVFMSYTSGTNISIFISLHWIIFHYDRPICMELCGSHTLILYHDDVISWKHFPCYWPFVRGIHRTPVNHPHKGQWRGALVFFFICAWMNGWVNNREAGDLTRHCAYYDGTIIQQMHSLNASKRIPFIVNLKWSTVFTKYVWSFVDRIHIFYTMMTSSHGNIFRVTGHLCGGFTEHRWIPRTKASDGELWWVFLSAPEWTAE